MTVMLKKKDEPIYREMRSLSPYFLIIGGVYLAVTVVLCIVRGFDYTLPIGAIYGTAVAVLNFLLLGKSAQKAIRKRDPKSANIYMSRCYAFRYLGLIAMFSLAAVVPFINLVAALPPLFFPRISIMIRAAREKD